MNQQKQSGIASIVIILIIVGVLVVAGGIWYWQGQKGKPSVCTQDTKLCPDGSYVSRTGPNCEFAACPQLKTVDWESLIPDIKIALQQAFPERIFYENELGISEKDDITGDGIQEALVTIGHGATTDELVLMRIENNKPVVSRFKQKGGEISYLVFSEGAGGAGRYGSGTELIEDKNMIYFAHHSAYNQSSDSCGAEAYQWNSQTKIFEFDVSLSNEAGQDSCSKVCSEIASDPDLNFYFQRICR